MGGEEHVVIQCARMREVRPGPERCAEAEQLGMEILQRLRILDANVPGVPASGPMRGGRRGAGRLQASAALEWALHWFTRARESSGEASTSFVTKLHLVGRRPMIITEFAVAYEACAISHAEFPLPKIQTFSPTTSVLSKSAYGRTPMSSSSEKTVCLNPVPTNTRRAQRVSPVKSRTHGPSWRSTTVVS